MKKYAKEREHKKKMNSFLSFQLENEDNQLC